MTINTEEEEVLSFPGNSTLHFPTAGIEQPPCNEFLLDQVLLLIIYTLTQNSLTKLMGISSIPPSKLGDTEVSCPRSARHQLPEPE